MSADTNIKVNYGVLVAQLIFVFVWFAAPLFLGAGTLNWLAGWAFLVIFEALVLFITGWLAINNPSLLVERMSSGKADQKAWDKVWYFMTAAAFTGWLFVMGLDAVRFGWSHIPGWLQAAGAVILLVSLWIMFLTFRENSFLSPMVRVQHDRGQTVVSTGPYHFVRHPMYAGFLGLMVGTGLLLGSWLGFVAGIVLLVLVARRAVLEENTLRAELTGYDQYMTQVRYRLIPGVW